MSTTLPRCAVIGAGSSGITAALAGRYRPPARAAMAADIREDLAEMRQRHVASKRHTIQVDSEGSLRDLDRERKAGAQRAAAAGFVPPLAHRRPVVPA